MKPCNSKQEDGFFFGNDEQTFAYRYRRGTVKRYATLKDVAELAGTSVGTVSYVLNDKKDRYISDETRKKVLDAAKELEYVKSLGASSLKGKSRKLIAILIPQYENQFFTRIVIASERVFVKHGYDMIICNTLDSPERENAILNRMIQQRVDGILITPTSKGAENTALARRVGMKMVVIDRALAGVKEFFWVATHNYGLGFTGASHLFSKGHRRIGYVGWKSGIGDLDARRQAVFDAAAKWGIPHETIHVEEGEFSPREGYELTKRILEKHPEITAIFYGFNVQALGGVNCLEEHGYSIPEDISVLIIGSPEWVSAGRNHFTHLDMHDFELGRKAANLLLSQITENDVPVQHIIQECSLVEGTSVKDISKTLGGEKE